MMFIQGYILDAYNMFVGKFNNFINQQKRIAVGQFFFYLLGVVQRRLIRIVYRYIFGVLILFNILLYFFCKIYIGRMAGPVGNDMAFDGKAHQVQGLLPRPVIYDGQVHWDIAVPGY